MQLSLNGLFYFLDLVVSKTQFSFLCIIKFTASPALCLVSHHAAFCGLPTSTVQPLHIIVEVTLAKEKKMAMAKQIGHRYGFMIYIMDNIVSF